jgi:hypothetical protein
MSDRIVNLMNAERFFNRKRNKHEMKRLEAERFSLTAGDAKKKLRNTQIKTVKKVAKRSTPDIDFQQWQIDLATKLFSKGKP